MFVTIWVRTSSMRFASCFLATPSRILFMSGPTGRPLAPAASACRVNASRSDTLTCAGAVRGTASRHRTTASVTLPDNHHSVSRSKSVVHEILRQWRNHPLLSVDDEHELVLAGRQRDDDAPPAGSVPRQRMRRR